MLNKKYRILPSFVALGLSGLAIGSVWASDLAVNKLLQGEQPAHRSQIMSQQQLETVEQETIVAKNIVEKNIQDHKKGMEHIPAGNFLSGDENIDARIESPYKMDVTEVSNKDYKYFIIALAKQSDSKAYAYPDEPEKNTYQPRYWSEYRSTLFINSPASKVAPFNADTFTQAENPVVGVDWWDAYAYCKWAKKRLPSALEWEKAARGLRGNIWPWGNEWDYAKGNTGGDKWGEVDGFIYAAPVVSFGSGVSPYGLLNMAGNVAEWSAGSEVMGGSSNSRPSAVRASSHKVKHKNYRSFNIGFRCASDA